MAGTRRGIWRSRSAGSGARLEVRTLVEEHTRGACLIRLSARVQPTAFGVLTMRSSQLALGRAMFFEQIDDWPAATALVTVGVGTLLRGTWSLPAPRPGCTMPLDDVAASAAFVPMPRRARPFPARHDIAPARLQGLAWPPARHSASCSSASRSSPGATTTCARPRSWSRQTGDAEMVRTTRRFAPAAGAEQRPPPGRSRLRCRRARPKRGTHRRVPRVEQVEVQPVHEGSPRLRGRYQRVMGQSAAIPLRTRERRSPCGRYRSCGPYRGRVALLAVLTVLEVALGALQPWPLKILVVDNVLGGPPPAAIVARRCPALDRADDRRALLLASSSAGSSCSSPRKSSPCCTRRCRSTRASGSSTTCAERLFKAHLQALGMRHHGSVSAGDSVYRLEADAYCIENLVMKGLFPAAEACLTLSSW